MTILLIDIGNSSVKLIEYRDDAGFGCPQRMDIDRLVSIDFSRYSEVALSNVGVNRRVDEFINKVSSSSTPIWRCDVDPLRDNLNTGYNPDKLGVDRWLVMLAVIGMGNENHSNIVVDAGSAITVDVLKKRRGHIGGQIIAGKPLLRNALYQPAKMREGSYHQDEALGLERDYNATGLPLGSSTSECVHYGIMTSISGVIMLVERLLKDLEKPSQIWFTGGDGEEIKDMFVSSTAATHSQVEFDANLVFRGMLVQLKNRDLVK